MFKASKLITTYKNEFLLGVLLIFPLLPIELIGFLGIFVSAFLIVINKDNRFLLKEKKYSVICIAFYLILVISVIYTDNIANGFKEMSKTILILIFPISILLFSTIKKKQIKILLLFFLIVNIFLCIYIFGLAIEILAYKKMTFLKEANIFEKMQVFFKTPYHVPFNWSSTDFEMFLFFHKAYISMSLCLSAFISLYFMLYHKNKRILIVSLFLAYVIFCYFILYMSSVPNIISLIIGTLTIVLFKFNIKTNVIILSVGIITLMLFSKQIKFNSFVSKIETRIHQDFRADLWKCGWEVARKDLIFGIGFGDHDDGILSCYQSNDKRVYAKAIKQKMNSHNQFVSIIISGGFVCLILFLTLVFVNLRNGILSKDVLLLTFTLLIILNFSFENMLDRIYGIYFFSFFNSFFIKRHLTK